MPETVSVMNTPGCVFCEYAMHTLEQMLKDQKTKEKIEIALDNICKVMPKSVEVSAILVRRSSIHVTSFSVYCKDTEHLYRAFVYYLVSLFFPVSIQYLQCTHSLLHQMLEICKRHNQK